MKIKTTANFWLNSNKRIIAKLLSAGRFDLINMAKGRRNKNNVKLFQKCLKHVRGTKYHCPAGKVLL
jgi:hypothetical protein